MTGHFTSYETRTNHELTTQQRHGVVIVGPVVEDTSWQAHAAEGFSKADFHIDWDQQVVTCPDGKQSISWLPSTYPKSGMQFEARFARKDCAACPMRSRCTRSKVEPRTNTLQAREDYEALQSSRLPSFSYSTEHLDEDRLFNEHF